MSQGGGRGSLLVAGGTDRGLRYYTPDRRLTVNTPTPWAGLYEAARQVLAGLDQYVPDFSDPCTDPEKEALRTALAACAVAEGNLAEDVEHAAAAAHHARERNRLRDGLRVLAGEVGYLRVRIGRMDPGSPWPGELAAIERAAAALLAPAAAEGDAP